MPFCEELKMKLLGDSNGFRFNKATRAPDSPSSVRLVNNVSVTEVVDEQFFNLVVEKERDISSLSGNGSVFFVSCMWSSGRSTASYFLFSELNTDLLMWLIANSGAALVDNDQMSKLALIFNVHESLAENELKKFLRNNAGQTIQTSVNFEKLCIHFERKNTEF